MPEGVTELAATELAAVHVPLLQSSAPALLLWLDWVT
jgi:hypothetical protein